MSVSVKEAALELIQIAEEEKAVKIEIDKIESCKHQGFIGRVRVSVFQVDGFPEDADFHIDYELAADDKSKVITEELSSKELKESVEVLLKSKDYFIDINCNVQLGEADEEIKPADEAETEEEKLGVVQRAPHSVYKVRVEFSDIPDEMEFREELEGTCAGEPLTGKPPILHVKASYDKFDAVLASRHKELIQLSERYNEIVDKLEEAQAAEAAAKGEPESSAKESVKEKEEEVPALVEIVTETVIIEEEESTSAKVVELESTKETPAPAPTASSPSTSAPASPTPTPAAPAPTTPAETASTPTPVKESASKPAPAPAAPAAPATKKTATKKSTGTKEKTTKKLKKKVTKEEDEEEEEEKKDSAATTSTVTKTSTNWMKLLTEKAQEVIGYGMQHRNVFFFGIAAGLIYVYGDNASV